MRILVTGGAGYVGSHALRELARAGHEAIVYDNLSTGYECLARGFELIQGDLRDSAKLSQALRKIDFVMHFAALAFVGESVANPRKYFANNVEAGLNLLNCAMDAGVRGFIFSSTCAVYGTPARVPITEDMPRQPVSPYGVTKLLLEQALEAYERAYGFKYVALRYFNAAGAHESGEIGEMHDPETHLIPIALEVAAGIRPEMQVFGNDYPTPDGTCIRDYIHVTDLAMAHLAALDYLGAGNKSIALNLGTGRGYSVEEVLGRIEQVTGRSIRRRIVPRREGDPAALVADPSLAMQTFRWHPNRSLEDVIASAWRWLNSRHAQQSSASSRT